MKIRARVHNGLIEPLEQLDIAEGEVIEVKIINFAKKHNPRRKDLKSLQGLGRIRLILMNSSKIFTQIGLSLQERSRNYKSWI